MADAPKDSDQSMEDILQSIKRIIADEGEPAPAPTAPGSDVLELTELLAEDVAVPAAAPAVEPETTVAAPLSLDDIMADEPAPAPMVAAPEPEPEPTPAPKAKPAPAPEPIAMPAPAPIPTTVAAAPAPSVNNTLMSDTTLAASIAALNALSQTANASNATEPGPAFRSGTTVEDLALEAIRPVIKEWLDANLPALVRQLVEKEIRRLSVF